MVGMVSGNIVAEDLEEILTTKKEIDMDMYNLAAILSI